MFCTNCGNKIIKTEKFCTQCGQKTELGEITKRDTAVDNKIKHLPSTQEVLKSEDEKAANGMVKSGIVFIVFGLALTGITYAFAEPGGSYYVFWGLPIYGFYRLIKGLNYNSSIGDSSEEIQASDKKEIIGWYKEATDYFLCSDCFSKATGINTADYMLKTEDDLKQNIYTCDECKKEFSI
ncbi:MAG: zinc ribbon domain-containing protein [Candidatus Paceibacterota bacterium]